MKGFQLALNNQKVNVALKKGGVITIIMTIECLDDLDSTIDVDFSGMQFGDKKEIKYNWLNAKLDIGDELKVKLVNVVNSSTPKSIEELSQKEMDERDLQSFRSLEKTLKRMNLI